MAHVLLVEDEWELAQVTKRYLEKEDYQVTVIADGREALRFLFNTTVDMLILDIMLPNVDGLTICETIRKRKNTPIIIISAKTDEESRIMGLDLGADDYLVKPYSVRELVARVNAQLRRSKGGYITELSDGDLRLNLSSNEAFLGKVPLALTSKEFNLLRVLMENSGRVLRKEYLLDAVWGAECESELSTLTVHIGKLREKIEANPKKPERIVTVWGTGYRYEECR